MRHRALRFDSHRLAVFLHRRSLTASFGRPNAPVKGQYSPEWRHFQVFRCSGAPVHTRSARASPTIVHARVWQLCAMENGFHAGERAHFMFI